MFDVLKNRYIYIWVSLTLVIFSLLMFLFKDLNLWIDMTWGTQTEYSFEWNIDINLLNEKIEDFTISFNSEFEDIVNSSNLYLSDWNRQLTKIVWFNTNFSDEFIEEAKISFRDDFTEVIRSTNETVVVDRYISIWKSFWDYIKNTAIITLIIALVAISIYIAFAFFWVVNWINPATFALIALVTLFHDVILTVWFYVFLWWFIPSFQIDTFFITAILTILWYSINDTIVILDRIRYNLRLHWWKTKKLDEIVNLSVRENITRSIYTSLTLVFVLFTVFLFGPESLKWFMVALMLWTIIWTYSSIFIASPLLYELNKNNKISAYIKKEVSDDDKIVV